MDDEIGEAAGTIWRHLAAEREATTLRRLKNSTGLSDHLLLMGLGWLAREGKVRLNQRPRGLEVALREGQAT